MLACRYDPDMMAFAGLAELGTVGTVLSWIAASIGIATGLLVLVDRLVGPHWVPRWDRALLGDVFFGPTLQLTVKNRSKARAHDVRLSESPRV